MAKKDKGQREAKKPKKDSKKTTIAKILPEPIEVEEVRRSRRRPAEAEV